MAIMTPRGLKLRFPAEFAFSLMGDLWARHPRTDAFRVLKTCEAISLTPSALGYCTGIIVAACPTLAWAVVPGIVGGKVAGELITRTPLLRLTGVLALGCVWSCLHSYGLLLSAAMFLTYHQNGILGMAYWVVGSIVAEVVTFIIAYVEMRRVIRRLGVTLWDTEQRFLRACHMHARQLDVQLDLERAGLDNPDWRFCLLDYAAKYPHVVARHQCMVDAYDLAMGRIPATPPPVREGRPSVAEEIDVPANGAGDWPFAGPRRAWAPGDYYNELTAVALPDGLMRLDRRKYINLLAERYAWAARREDWSVDELRRRAEQLCPAFSYTCELDSFETIDGICEHIITCWQGQQALNEAYAFDTAYDISNERLDLEETIAETNVETLLFALTTADTT